MSKKYPFLVSTILISLAFSSPAGALEAMLQQQPQAVLAPVSGAPVFDPYTVTDVMVDKTAKNAVVAREEAIVEAQRAAFQKLAERNLTPDEMKTFTMPDDKVISSVVQDFEIKKEQLSFTRYAANFTVRFRDGVRNFINVQLPVAALEQGDVGVMEAPQSKFVLVLPYLESISGETLLWEEPNPWRNAWQSGLASKQDTTGRQFFVPLGDITDVSAGSSDSVWSGDYSVIEKLRATYKADEVVLAVANKSGPSFTVDVYSWKDGRFVRQETLKPYLGDLLSEQDTYKVGALEVLKFLQQKKMMKRPIEAVAAISRELTGTQVQDVPVAVSQLPPPGVPQLPRTGIPSGIIIEGGSPNVSGGMIPQVRQINTPVPQATLELPVDPTPYPNAPVAVAPVAIPPGGLMEVDATMNFSDFSRWMEMQKRLSRMVPPVKVDIRSISKDGAAFTMKFQGNVDILKRAMADNGIALGQGLAAPSQTMASRPVYDLQLVD